MKKHEKTTEELKKTASNSETELSPKEISMRKELEERTETLQRVQAEFENYKKRVEKEHKEFVQYAEQELIAKLLPVLDSFELSIKNSQDPKKFKKGVELIFAQIVSTLRERGLQKIDAVGKEFDPYLHEVLMTEESNKDNIILEELQPGYRLKDKVLRHTKVKIGKKK